MAVPNFRELLSQKTDEVERPRALANGHYIGTIKGHEFGTSRQKQTPYVRFLLGVDEEASDVPDGANAGIDLSKKQLPATYYITPTALYRISDMLDATLGKQEGRSFDERIPETRGVRVMFQVTQREVQDESGNVTATFEDVGTIIAAGG